MQYFVLYTDNSVLPKDLYSFHGAFGQKMKFRSAWHNNDRGSGKSIHRYPLIQYKILQHHLAIVALESEKETIFKLGADLPFILWIDNKPNRLLFKKLVRFQESIELQEGFETYLCNNWLPMNSDQFEAYKSLCTERSIPLNNSFVNHPDLIHFFETLLKHQLVKQLKSLETNISLDDLKLRIISTQLEHRQTNYYNDSKISMMKGVKVQMNLNWPIHLGIGKGAAIGYGMFRKTPK